MNLFGWLKRDPESKGMVRGRAVVIPHLPNVETISNSVESNFSADSISTLGVTVRLLKPDESAASVGSHYPRLPVTGLIRTSPIPEGCQRLHVNIPNWMHLKIRQERYVFKEHAEVPVWVDPKKDRIWRIDRDRLIEELLPERPHGLELYEKYGMSGIPDGAIKGAGMTMNATASLEGFVTTIFEGAADVVRETALKDLKNPFKGD